MSRRDGTGPQGQGAATGKGLGQCTGVNASMNAGRIRRNVGKPGRGSGTGLGLGRGFQTSTEAFALKEEKNILKRRLDAIERILDETSDK